MRSVRASRPSSTVFDASVLVRATIDAHERALELVAQVGRERRVHAPELIWSELANALRNAAVASRMSSLHALTSLELGLRVPIQIHPSRALVSLALERAVATRLSVYDALYLALAEALDAPLVTFDRDFCDVYDKVELLA